ncbi:MAG: pseudouridine synthase [Rhizobiales bacterium]|nr:pseudouridine synthase [Hyphomicrobiales bacterium]
MTDKKTPQDGGKPPHDGERIAKVMARAGLASRREAEAWIAAGRVSVNGAAITSPALNVTAKDRIAVDGKPMPTRERTRLFLYHKPRGLVTTHADPQGRPTIFGALPKELPRLISIGRLDLNTEGLLLLTNDGGLARVLELPETGWLRRYRVRANGTITQAALDALRDGVTVDGIRYGAIEATLDRIQGANVWLTFAIREGKNREVRNVLDHLGLRVNRLIRVSFGPFQLAELKDGAVEEVKARVLREQLGERITTLAGADFSEAPVVREKNATRAPRRHPEVRAGEAGEPRRAARPHREDKHDQGAHSRDKRSPGKHDQGQRSGSPRRASDRARGKGRGPAHPAPGKKR